MSRVEDDRQAQRAAERLVQEKQLQESKAKQRQEGESAFSRLVQQQKAALPQQPKTPQQQSLGKSVLARLQQEGKSGELRGQQRQLGKSETAQPGQGQGQVTQGRQQDQGVTQTRRESRATDAKVTREALEERGDALSKDSEHAADGVQARLQGRGSLKTNADGGGKQGDGDGKDKKDGSEMGASFRFNPALMAPVPVAKPKPTAGSERLRALANEIAQKIVERVRVGTNAAGNAEFQIDLRNDVLSGLSIKLTAKNGKIQAVFSGGDRDVLKMLEEQRDGLKSALAGRGLTLEELRVEAKS
ncbi:flagellar hook-length control protein FliK [Archangium violaceum]|uniref:flagellar hook-length control protein FliK n=1 Tax=Archangium violaceum TaxID=83451 RepID=UPI00193B8CF8|nr:flagellar hook-length control protein FliK [Archangium violaceum]QRK04574.1 flagellar hook-length control protein FliK [Archangium violaceum]